MASALDHGSTHTARSTRACHPADDDGGAGRLSGIRTRSAGAVRVFRTVRVPFQPELLLLLSSIHHPIDLSALLNTTLDASDRIKELGRQDVDACLGERCIHLFSYILHNDHRYLRGPPLSATRRTSPQIGHPLARAAPSSFWTQYSSVVINFSARVDCALTHALRSYTIPATYYTDRSHAFHTYAQCLWLALDSRVEDLVASSRCVGILPACQYLHRRALSSSSAID